MLKRCHVIFFLHKLKYLLHLGFPSYAQPILFLSSICADPACILLSISSSHIHQALNYANRSPCSQVITCKFCVVGFLINKLYFIIQHSRALERWSLHDWIWRCKDDTRIHFVMQKNNEGQSMVSVPASFVWRLIHCPRWHLDEVKEVVKNRYLGNLEMLIRIED